MRTYQRVWFLLTALGFGLTSVEASQPPKEQQKKQVSQAPGSKGSFPAPNVSTVDDALRYPNKGLKDQTRMKQWARQTASVIEDFARGNKVDTDGRLINIVHKLESFIFHTPQDSQKKALKKVIREKGLSDTLQRALAYTLRQSGSQGSGSYSQLSSIVNLLDDITRLTTRFNADFVRQWDLQYGALLQNAQVKDIHHSKVVRAIYVRSRINRPLGGDWLDVWYMHAYHKMSDFTVVQIVDLVYSLGRLKPPKTDYYNSFMHAWYQRAKQDVPYFRIKDLANCVYGLGLLQVDTADEEFQAFIQSWYRNARDKIANFDFLALTNSIYGLGLLSVSTEDQGCKAFLEAWLNEASKDNKIANFDAIALSNAIYGLGKIQMHEEVAGLDTFLRKWYQVANRPGVINTFTTVELSNSLSGLGRLMLDTSNEDFRTFIQNWCYRAKEIIEQFDATQLSNNVLYLGKLEVDIGMTACNDFLQLWYQRAYDKLPYFDASGLTTSIYGLGRLGVDINNPKFQRFLQAWYPRATELVRNFDSMSLSSSMYGLGKLQVGSDNRQFKDFLQEWYLRAKEKLSTFSPLLLGNTVYGLAGLSVKQDQRLYDFLNRWCVEAAKRINHFQQDGLANSVHSLGRLAPEKSSELYTFMQWWYIRASSDDVQWKRGEVVSSVIQGLGMLAFPRPERTRELASDVLNSVLSGAQENVAHFSTDQRITILQGLALLHVALPVDDQLRTRVSDLAASIAQEVSVDADMKKEKIRQLFTALRYFNIGEEQERLKQIHGSAQEEASSTLEQKVVSTLREMDVTFTEQPEYAFFVKDILSTVDIAFPNTKTVVEIDGPSHFFGVSGERIPSDALKDKLLEKAGWTVIRIPDYEWDQNNTQEQKKSYLREKLQNLIVPPQQEEAQQSKQQAQEGKQKPSKRKKKRKGKKKK